MASAIEQVRFYIKTDYGTERYYFYDETEAKVVRKLTRRTTLLETDILALRLLGVNVVEVDPPTKRPIGIVEPIIDSNEDA